LGEFQGGLARFDAAAIHSQVQFDKRPNGCAGGSTGLIQRLDVGRVIDNRDRVGDAAEGGEPLELEELVPEAYLLLMAGTGNTAKMLNCGLQHLLANPGWLGPLEEELAGYRIERLMGGMGAFPRLRATLMEMERMFPAAPVLSRVVEEPFEFHGHRLPRGTRVLHLQTLPHFLDEVYADPYRFDVTRQPNPAQIGFGAGGPHFCLGANLARREIAVMFDEIRRRLPNLRATGEPAYLQSNFINGIKSLPARIDA